MLQPRQPRRGSRSLTLRTFLGALRSGPVLIEHPTGAVGSGDPAIGVQQRLVPVIDPSLDVSAKDAGELGTGMRERPRRGRGASAAIVVAATIGTLVACTGSSTPSPSTSSRSSIPVATSATPTPDATATAASEVLTVYRGYWAARVKAQASPDQPVPKDLDTFAIDKALTDVKSSILRFRQQGIEFRGEPVLSPTVASVQVGDRASASISDCVDSTHWTPVFASTGKSALAPGQPMRVVVESSARIYAGRWVIDSSVAHRDRTC